MSSGRWPKYPEEKRNYGYSENYDRHRLPDYSSRYDSGRYYSTNEYNTSQKSSQYSRRYESTSDHSRRNSNYSDRNSKDRKYRSRERSKEKLADNIKTSNKNDQKKSSQDSSKMKSERSELSSVNTSGNKRSLSTNVLSIEDAVKLSNKENENDEQQPEKKRKLDRIDSVEDKNEQEDAFHSHLKDIQTCKKDLVEIKTQIKAKLIVLEEIKSKFNVECDSLKELQIMKRSLSKKVKKMCRALAKVDEEKLENLDNSEDVQIGDLDEIINVESNSESESSSSVEFINETVTINDNKESSSDSDSDSSESESELKSKKEIKRNKIEYKLKSSPLSHKTAKSNGSKHSSHLNISTTNQMKEIAINQMKETAANQIPPSSVSSANQKAETKNEPVETTFKLENVNNEPIKNFQLDFKTSAEISSYDAIEPKLNTIVISDEDKTFIADIKIFNNRLFVSASHGLLRQYHLGTQECVRDYKGHSGLVHCILPTVYPVGVNRLISGGLDKLVLIHNIDTGLVLNQIEEDSSIFSLCDHIDFIYYGTVSGNVATFSLEKNRKMSSFSASTSAISCLAATKEGNNHILFVGSNDGEYSMWDAITYMKLRVISPISYREIPIGFVLLQKQRILAFSKNYVHFINYVKTKSSTIFNHFDPMVSICLTRNYIIIGAICGKISVYKIKSSNIQKIPIRTIVNTSSPIISLTFYNNTIISGDKNGKVYFNRLVEDKSL